MISKRSLLVLIVPLTAIFALTAVYRADSKVVPVTVQPETTDVLKTEKPPVDDRGSSSSKTITSVNLSASNTVVLIGEIRGNGSSVAQEIIEKSKTAKSLYLVINSPGGSVLDGALIISAMQSSRIPINTVCLQICASMAAVIHQYGTQRMQVDRSILMFHDAAGSLQGYFPHMRSRLEMLDRYITKMQQDISRRTGMPLAEFLDAQHREFWIDAEDALQRKFTDKLVAVQFESSLLESPVKDKLFLPVTSNKLGLEL